MAGGKPGGFSFAGAAAAAPASAPAGAPAAKPFAGFGGSQAAGTTTTSSTAAASATTASATGTAATTTTTSTAAPASGGFNFAGAKPTTGFGAPTGTGSPKTGGFGSSQSGGTTGLGKTGGFGFGGSAGTTGLTTATTTTTVAVQVTMETKFEKLPEEVRKFILEIHAMKEASRQNLELLRRTNLRTLDDLSEDVQTCRLTALEVQNKQEQLGFRARSLREDSKANARDAQRFGLWSLQQTKVNSAVGAVPSEFYWGALTKMEGKLQAYTREIEEIELQLQSTASRGDTDGYYASGGTRAKYNVYGQRGKTGAEEIGQLIKVQSDALLRMSAQISSVHVALEETRLRYKQRFREDPFTAADLAEAEQERRQKNKLHRPTVLQLPQQQQQQQAGQQQQGGFGGKGFGTTGGTTGGFGSGGGFGKSTGFGSNTGTGGFGSANKGFGFAGGTPGKTGGFGGGFGSTTQGTSGFSSTSSHNSAAGDLMTSNASTTGGFGSGSGFGGGSSGGFGKTKGGFNSLSTKSKNSKS